LLHPLLSAPANRDKALERSQRVLQDSNGNAAGLLAQYTEGMQALETQLAGLKTRTTQLENELGARGRKARVAK
jgi:peptidoglycan hydrolase CwlO-like protein